MQPESLPGTLCEPCLDRPDVKEDLEDIACEICGRPGTVILCCPATAPFLLQPSWSRFVAFDDFAEHMKGHGSLSEVAQRSESPGPACSSGETASSSSRPKGDMKACEAAELQHVF